MNRRFLKRRSGVAILLVSCLALFLVFSTGCKTPVQHHYAFRDTEDGRLLVIDGRIKDVVDTSDWSSSSRYVSVMELPTHMFVSPRKALLFGSGAGSLAKRIIRSGWGVDVIEADSALAGLARHSFGLTVSGATLRTTDARTFLANDTVTYDIVLIDAIAVADVPARLLTREAFGLISNRMGNNGVLAIAMESIGWNDPMVRSVCATLQQCFTETFVLPIAEPPDRFGSIVLLASNARHDDLIRDVPRNTNLDPFWRYSMEYEKTHAWDNRFTLKPDQDRIETDQRNTWEDYNRRISQEASKLDKNYRP